MCSPTLNFLRGGIQGSLIRFLFGVGSVTIKFLFNPSLRKVPVDTFLQCKMVLFYFFNITYLFGFIV